MTNANESAIAQTTAAAGGKAVTVVGGAGLQLFGNIDPERVELEKIGVQEVGARTSLRFRVRK